MNIDITSYLKELLFEHNSLVIPGFGALTLQYAPSTIDHVQGLLNPPSKSISFDNNLIVNDGKLVDIIQNKHQVSTEEATEQIKKFVIVIKDQLDRREMVNLLGVGRLYKDFENKIQFIPDSTNFNKESFGLPTVNFIPILREHTTPESIIPSGVTTNSYKSEINKPKNNLSFLDRFKALSEEHSWLPIALIAIGFIIPGYFLISKYIINAPNTTTEVKVNQSPGEPIANMDGEEEEGDDNEDAADFAEDQASTNTEADAVDTESITVSPNQRICVVSVGAFGNKANAQKRIEQVYDYGFDALPEKYIKNGKELTKVGIQFAFETEEEFDTKLKAIKKRFNNAVVIKKE